MIKKSFDAVIFSCLTLFLVALLVEIQLAPFQGVGFKMRQLNQWVDQYNLFEVGLLNRTYPKFDTREKYVRYNYFYMPGLDYAWIQIQNHENITLKQKPEYLKYEHQKDMIIFFVNGN